MTGWLIVFWLSIVAAWLLTYEVATGTTRQDWASVYITWLLAYRLTLTPARREHAK